MSNQEKPILLIKSGDPLIKIDNVAIDESINDLIFNEKIYVPLNPVSNNIDVREFTLFLMTITETTNLQDLYDKITVSEWRAVIEQRFSVGRESIDILRIKRDSDLSSFGFKSYYISVTFKPLIQGQTINRSKLDDLLLKEEFKKNLSVVNFVFFENPQTTLDDRAIFLGRIGYVYIDRLRAEEQKKRIQNEINKEISNQPLLQNLEAKIIANEKKAKPQATATEKIIENEPIIEPVPIKINNDVFLAGGISVLIIGGLIGVMIYNLGNRGYKKIM